MQDIFQIQKSSNAIYPRNVVYFRYTLVNTLYKGDKRHNNKYTRQTLNRCD
jgi:hypothetical protein